MSTHRYAVGEKVIMPSQFCPRCDGDTGELTGRIVGFEEEAAIASDHPGRPPYYLVGDVGPHRHVVPDLVFGEAELEAGS